MKKTIWISYDLGIKGDYRGLYAWLDDISAEECGDGLALIKIEIPEKIAPPDYIKDQLTSNVELSKTDRIYVIWREKLEDRIKGRFIFGKRKGSPWNGFGNASSQEDDT